MKTRENITIGLLALVLAAVLYMKFTANTNADEGFVSTSGRDKERLKSLNMDKPSTKELSILDASKLSIPKVEKKSKGSEDAEYKADPQSKWIIQVLRADGGQLNKSDLSRMFDTDWRRNFNSLIYGFSPVSHRWTFADGGDSPELYDTIHIAVDLQEIYLDDAPDFDRGKLEKYITELQKRFKQYPARLKYSLSVSIDQAIAKAKKLVEQYNEFNHAAIIILQSDSPYDGMEAWDALESLGLTWGDGDLFHWENASDYGSQQHFSVWTTTEPGYFLPEPIKRGSMKPGNLVFGFLIPQSADPKNIYDIMLTSIKYCQKRLGGRILNDQQKPYNEIDEKKKLTEFLAKMTSKGLIPGSGNVLTTY